MSYKSNVVSSSGHVFTTRWQHHSKLGCQSCAHKFTHKSKHTRCLQVFLWLWAWLHCICFAWERDRHWNGKMMLYFCSFFFFYVSVLVRSSVWVPEKALAEIEREGASSGQSGPLYISSQAVWDIIASSVFGLFPTYTEETPLRVLGGRWTSISPTSPITGLPVWRGSH